MVTPSGWLPLGLLQEGCGAHASLPVSTGGLRSAHASFPVSARGLWTAGITFCLHSSSLWADGGQDPPGVKVTLTSCPLNSILHRPSGLPGTGSVVLVLVLVVVAAAAAAQCCPLALFQINKEGKPRGNMVASYQSLEQIQSRERTLPVCICVSGEQERTSSCTHGDYDLS